LHAGAELLLVGRDPERLVSLFPGIKACGYDQLAKQGRDFDLLVHLAVVNSNVDASADVFHDVNVGHMLEVQAQARSAAIGKFINVSSIHALDDGNNSSYAASKRAGVTVLRDLDSHSLSLYLPAIVGTRLAGRLAVLDGLPAPILNLMVGMLSALRPTLHVEKLAHYLLERAGTETETEVILSEGQGSNLFYRSVKRTIDLGFAVAVTVAFWWLMIVIWIVIKLQSPGPGIFAQDRVGRRGKMFTCYKFRTMKLGTAQAATNEVSASSVTALGHFLRRTKIDELPQIWNIFRNEVSLVGPRPCLPVQGALVEARRRHGVLELKPGITGLAQVNGIDMSEPERLARWDVRYGALQSLILDLKIILATVMGGGQGDKVAK
jgi:lipopolysaccharide/colanic/teichoic acid biosynthesis glycosyltransferase